MATATKENLPEVRNHPAYLLEYPDHKLNRVTNDETFKCHGCMRSVIGTGTRYKFEFRRNVYKHWDHHICCAVESFTQPNPTHPVVGELKFCPAPPERTKGRFCKFCEEPVNAFAYHNSSTGVLLHPCCAFHPCNCTIVPANDSHVLSQATHRNSIKPVEKGMKTEESRKKKRGKFFW